MCNHGVQPFLPGNSTRKQSGRSDCSNMIISTAEINSLCCLYIHSFKESLKRWLSPEWEGMLCLLSWFCINKATVYSAQLDSYLRAMKIFKSLKHKKLAVPSISSVAVYRNYLRGLGPTLKDSDGIGLWYMQPRHQDLFLKASRWF